MNMTGGAFGALANVHAVYKPLLSWSWTGATAANKWRPGRHCSGVEGVSRHVYIRGVWWEQRGTSWSDPRSVWDEEARLGVVGGTAR